MFCCFVFMFTIKFRHTRCTLKINICLMRCASFCFRYLWVVSKWDWIRARTRFYVRYVLCCWQRIGMLSLSCIPHHYWPVEVIKTSSINRHCCPLSYNLDQIRRPIIYFGKLLPPSRVFSFIFFLGLFFFFFSFRDAISIINSATRVFSDAT